MNGTGTEGPGGFGAGPAPQGLRPSAPAAIIALRKAWRGLAPRERQGVLLAAWIVGLGLLWALGVAPAWRTLRDAPPRLAELEAQWQQMQRQAGEVQRWRKTTVPPADRAEASLQVATGRLGPGARLSVQGERAVLSFEGQTPAALQAWLAEVRAGARARAVEAQWTRQAGGLAGTLVVAVPPAR